MKIDFGDVFASGIGWLFKQIFLFAVAVWTGCTIAAAALLVGVLAEGTGFDFSDLRLMLISPVLLLTIWLIPNLCFLGAAGYWFVRTETSSYIAWSVLATVEAAVCLAGSAGELLDGTLAVTAAWISGFVLLGMMGTGIWFIRQWHLNRWAVEIALLKSENEMRRAELEEATDHAGNREIRWD